MPPRFLAAVLLLLVATTAWADEMFDPRFREGAPSDALVKGPPRLSRGHLNAFVDLLEAAFDVALTAQAEQALRDALENEFDGGSPQDREAFLTLVDAIAPLRDQARRDDASAVRAGLRRFRAALDARIRARPAAPAHRQIAAVLERRHEVVVAGEPALKGVPVDAYIEMAEFVAGLARNEPVRLSPGRRSALRDYLAKDLASLKRPVRERLASAHRFWLRAKARWDRAKDARRFLMRWEAVRLAARLKTPAVKVRPGTDLAAYAREAARVAASMEAYDHATALARNPEALFDVLKRGLAFEDKAPAFSFMYR